MQYVRELELGCFLVCEVNILKIIIKHLANLIISIVFLVKINIFSKTGLL